jgi:hypothetical protein
MRRKPRTNIIADREREKNKRIESKEYLNGYYLFIHSFIVIAMTWRDAAAVWCHGAAVVA